MELLDFLGLGEAEQWEEFSENCVFLADYDDVDSVHKLYRLHGFYVELTSVPVARTFLQMSAFLYGPRLEKYMAGDLDFIHTDMEIDFPGT